MVDSTIVTIATAGATTLLTKGAEAPANTLNLIWRQVFGSVDLWLEKQALRRKKELEDFSKKVDENLQKIPSENIQEPKYSILGPVMEASQYYLEEEELREIFAKLVSASFDTRKNGKLHNSFIEKVKSLSSDDARFLSFIKNNEAIAICEYLIENNQSNGGKITLSSIICLAFEEEYIERCAISIDNLVHLGLLKIDLDRFFADERRYDCFYKTNLYSESNNNNPVTNRRLKVEKLLEEFSKEKIALDNKVSIKEVEDWLKVRKVELRKGICQLTSLGKTFVEICC